MTSEQKNPLEADKPDVSTVRTKDNPIGIDDIGLPAQLQPDEAVPPAEVKPDPARVNDRS